MLLILVNCRVRVFVISNILASFYFVSFILCLLFLPFERARQFESLKNQLLKSKNDGRNLFDLDICRVCFPKGKA